jgi:hypothetical protein
MLKPEVLNAKASKWRQPAIDQRKDPSKAQDSLDLVFYRSVSVIW